MTINYTSLGAVPIVSECIKTAPVLDRIWDNKMAAKK